MDFGVLGPVQARCVSHVVPLGTFKQRVLIAVLLSAGNAVVSTDRLIASLWGADPPRTAAKNLQVYVYHLRKALGGPTGDGRRLEWSRPGYRLETRPEELDLGLFERLSASGRDALAAGRPDVAARDLRSALALWRGEAFAGLHEVPLLHSEAGRLEERRTAVREDRFDAELALGRHHDVVNEIGDLVREHPLRERLRMAQIRALYLSGRKGEALAAYDAVRRLLASELGLPPSRRLQRIQEQVLADDPALEFATGPVPVVAVALVGSSPGMVRGPADPGSVPAAGTGVEDATGDLSPRCGCGLAPRHLPRAVEDFTGRAAELAGLDHVLRPTPALPLGPGSPLLHLAVVTGAPGVGKTALAVQVAHRLSPHFPDGQICAELRTRSGGTRPAADVLTELLRALGREPGPGQPGGGADPGELSRLFRAHTAGRRVLVLLDDAVDEAQVRPLLPAGPGSVIVVTSRTPLAGLESAHTVALDVFTPHESHDLIGRIVGAERVAADAPAAARIAELVGHLPLAIRIAGAKIAARPHWSLGDCADRLSDRPLAESTIGDLSVRDRLETAYRQLDEAARRAFRLVGLLPDDGFTLAEAAYVLGVLPIIAQDLLDHLVYRHLLYSAAADPPRYRQQPMLRLYARERARHERLPFPLPLPSTGKPTAATEGFALSPTSPAPWFGP